MTAREIFLKALRFERGGRLPCWEWASWWDLTRARWEREGLPAGMVDQTLHAYFGLDVHYQTWVSSVVNEDCYDDFRAAPEERYEAWKKKNLFPKDLSQHIRRIRGYKAEHDAGRCIAWYTMEGWFWFPRKLFGIEGHLFSFHDHPALYHAICRDLLEHHKYALDILIKEDAPEFVLVAEDFCYNHGPMLSEEMFNEFMLPYYRELTAFLHSWNVKVIIDSDGDVTKAVPWLVRTGADGTSPLERQAGVDAVRLKKDFPNFFFFGGFDKMRMKYGEEVMRQEFERLLPAIRQGGFIPAVDHQTPPDVSLENYKKYVRLLKEYTA